MKRKNGSVIVLCLFTLTLITACQPVESITVDVISGVWRGESGWPFLFLNEDGTLFQAASNSPENPFIFGQWQLEGTTLTSHADDESPFCAGYSATFQVEFIEEDKLKFILIKDDCPEGGGKEEEIWQRFSP
jgi:hypothetical protein